MFIIPQIGKAIRESAHVTQLATTAIVFVVLMIFTLISVQNTRHTLSLQKDQAINEKNLVVRDTVVNRLNVSGNLTRSGAALFEGSEAVTRDEWTRFFDKLNVQEKYDGISAIGFSPVIHTADKQAFEESVRTEGLSGYAITPEGERSTYAPVMYLQSYGGVQGTLGYDMYSDPLRKEAMDAAARSGSNGMTNSLNLLDAHTQGVVLYMPVYTRGVPTGTPAEREAALRGFVFVRLRTNDLFNNLLPGSEKHFGVTISETVGDKRHELFSSLPKGESEGLEKVRTSTIDMYNKHWELTSFARDSIVSAADSQRPWVVFQSGLAISLIASAAVFLLIKYRTRAFASEEEQRLQQAKNELLSLASHQLRTPATGVKQYIGMVLQGFAGKVSKDQTDLLEHAYRSNERQLQIINDFLYVAKIGSGSLTTTVHKFDLVPVIKDVTNEMAADMQEKNHKLKLTLPKSLTVSADEHSVRMIFENLLSNAIRYTSPGGKISVTLKRVLNDVQIEVKDNGIGVAKKDKHLLFKQFSRIPNELSREVNGSGIGLYLAQQLAHRNGGKITVESEAGQGSTFTLHLRKKSVRNITKTRPKA